MAIQYKYFKFRSPITGEITKRIGWSAEFPSKFIKRMKIDGEWVIVEEQDVITKHERLNFSESQEEITEQEFKSLNTDNTDTLIDKRSVKKVESFKLRVEENKDGKFDNLRR